MYRIKIILILIVAIIYGISDAQPLIYKKIGLEAVQKIDANHPMSKEEFNTIFKRLEKSKRNIFEILESPSGYLLVSDSLVGNYNATRFLTDFSEMKFDLLMKYHLDSLKNKLLIWEERVITTDIIDYFSTKDYVISETLTISFQFVNKEDLYYGTVGKGKKLEKGTHVYYPFVNSVSIVFSNRRNNLSYGEFKRTFRFKEDF